MTSRCSDQQSFILHTVKVIATAAVFLGHATRPDVLYDVDVTLLGRATIPVFFMVCAYFTAMSFARGGNFLTALGKRCFNLYFMFLPAAVLVLAMDLWLVDQGSPITENYKFDPDLSAGRIAVEFWQLLTFSGEYWSSSTIGQGIFSNQAMWFIDYMMAYTVMTGAWYLLSDARRYTVVAAMALIAGPTIMLLSPLWFAGVMAYQIHWRVETTVPLWRPVITHSTISIVQFDSRPLAITACALASAVWVMLESLNIGESLYLWTKTLAPYELRQYLGMAKRFAWQYTYIPVLFVFLVSSKYIFTEEVPARVKTVGRAVSRYCFPVFAIHFTTLYFVQSWIPNYDPSHNAADPYIVMLSTLVLSVVYGFACFRWIKPAFDRFSLYFFD